MRLLTWLTSTPLDEVTPATHGWLAAERDARIAELEAQLAASEDEKRRFQRMYGKASATIGAQRATNAQLRAERDAWRTSHEDQTAELRSWRLLAKNSEEYGAAVLNAGQVANTADADADAALVATAEHLGNEVGPDRTAAIEGAAITLRAHVFSPVHRDTACSCGWDALQGNHSHTPPQGEAREAMHARHVAEQLAAVGALGNLQLWVESSPPDLLDRDGDRWRWVRPGYSRAVERPKTREELDLNWGPVRDADPEEVPF